MLGWYQTARETMKTSDNRLIMVEAKSTDTLDNVPVLSPSSEVVKSGLGVAVQGQGRACVLPSVVAASSKSENLKI